MYDAMPLDDVRAIIVTFAMHATMRHLTIAGQFVRIDIGQLLRRRRRTATTDFTNVRLVCRTADWWQMRDEAHDYEVCSNRAQLTVEKRQTSDVVSDL